MTKNLGNTFEEEKYNNFYNSMLYTYNEFAQNDYLKKATDAFEYSPWDATTPENAKIQKDLYTVKKITNPFRQKVGFEGINILIEIAKKKEWKPEKILYLNSGDTAGDKNGVVGYAGIVFTEKYYC